MPRLLRTCLSCVSHVSCLVPGKAVERKFLVPWRGLGSLAKIKAETSWNKTFRNCQWIAESSVLRVCGWAPAIKQGRKDTRSVTLGVSRALGNSELNWTFLRASGTWPFVNPYVFFLPSPWYSYNTTCQSISQLNEATRKKKPQALWKRHTPAALHQKISLLSFLKFENWVFCVFFFKSTIPAEIPPDPQSVCVLGSGITNWWTGLRENLPIFLNGDRYTAV